jgi:OOP family OmpA-OmpF porin
VLAFSLAGCGGSTTTRDAAGVVSDTGGGDGSGSGDGRTAVIRLPEFPAPRVPDVTSLTKAATKTRQAIEAEVKLPPGLQVTGARCDSEGNVINRAGLTVGGGDDGSQVDGRAGTSQVSADGSGQITGGDVTYQVDADGSGQIGSGTEILQVDADGSGQYSDGTIVYQVEADGSGQYSLDEETYQVDADGSGQWDGPYGVVQNAGDGSGTWTGPNGTVMVNGDGTATVDGKTVKMAPMPKFALLGRLPKLKTLKPIGEPCGTLIRMPASVLFDFDQATLRPEAKPILAAVATALKKAPTEVRVNGHTDAMGSDHYNIDLSRRRAAAVVTALRADGLETPLIARGFGESQPVAPNTLNGKDDPAGRQLNRRVELFVPDSAS